MLPPHSLCLPLAHLQRPCLHQSRLTLRDSGSLSWASPLVRGRGPKNLACLFSGPVATGEDASRASGPLELTEMQFWLPSHKFWSGRPCAVVAAVATPATACARPALPPLPILLSRERRPRRKVCVKRWKEPRDGFKPLIPREQSLWPTAHSPCPTQGQPITCLSSLTHKSHQAACLCGGIPGAPDPALCKGQNHIWGPDRRPAANTPQVRPEGYGRKVQMKNTLF